MSYALHLPATLIVRAVALDAACGDPDWLPHPVKAIGWMIARGEFGPGYYRIGVRKSADNIKLLTAAASFQNDCPFVDSEA